MSASFSTENGQTTVTFWYTAPTATVAAIAGGAAEYLWQEEFDENGEVINPFDEATNQEKLDVLDAHVRRVIVDLANTNKSVKAQALARLAEADSEYQF